MYNYRFTVFTPCYNSADKIMRVVESLKMQTFKNFEWIIVDDCSTDNIDSLMQQVMKNIQFPVQYFRQKENLGKPSAINLGVNNAHGEFFLIIDADDSFAPDSLEILCNAYDSLPENIKPEISSVTSNCQDQHGLFIGTPYPSENDKPLICDVFEMRYVYKVEGEKWGFTKTDIMKEFPFNTTEDKFVTENTVWFAIANKYKSAFINRTLRTYYRHENSQSLSAIGQQKHPAGFVFYYREILNKYLEKMRLNIFDTLRLYKNYLKYTIYAKSGMLNSIGSLKTFSKRLLAFICIPLGLIAVVLETNGRKTK